LASNKSIPLWRFPWWRGGAIITKKLRSGVTRHEIEIALEDIERFINLKDGTVDIEELLAEPAE
jgi:hypothetical protein